jgi:Tol biopolymer transport system component
MKISRSLIALLAVLILVACTPSQEAETPTSELPTVLATAVVSVTETAVLPTATSGITATLEITATDTPLLGTPTSEVTPTTPAPATATAELTITPTLVLPSIPGRIAYLWSPEFSSGESPLTYNLNFAIPGSTPGEWQIETALSGLSAQFMFPSPDQSRFALTQYKNVETGELGYSRFGGNTFDVYVYELADGSFARFTDNHFEQYPEVSWSPNNREFTYAMNRAIWRVNLDDSSVQQLVDGFPGSLYNHSWSPDGQWLAIISARSEEEMVYNPNKLDIFNPSTGTLLPIVSEMEQGSLIWSPDSQWLAFTKTNEGGIFVLDVSTFAVTELLSPEHGYVVAAWSPDSLWLASIENPFREISPLYLSNVNTITTTELPPAADFRSITWSPDSTQIMTTVYDEEQAKLVIVNVLDGSTRELFAIDRVDINEREYGFEHILELQGLTWSPDGEWFLFYAEPEGTAGLYVIHYRGSEAYLIVETGLYSFDSRRAIWLSE